MFFVFNLCNIHIIYFIAGLLAGRLFSNTSIKKNQKFGK